ncbi:REN3A protein, partial [Polyodon spathula]|nr:REN3A protein [Polyodon spathula]
MGCTPSNSKATYAHDKVWRDLDTCSTLVSGLKSSVSTPERPSPRPCFEDPSMKQNFLNVPCRDYHGRSLSQPSSPDTWSTFSTPSANSPLCQPQPGIKPSSSDSHSSDSERPCRQRSLYPHLFSRAYINFKNPEDIVLFRDRFDGYVFIDHKGQEYPAVVEFAPFQKVSKKKLKKKDTKSGSIEEDPEYKKFLESYCGDEEKATANPETLLGEIEAKTRELIAKRTTPLLEYIKNKKLEKQRIREEKREERRRRELEKKRMREEEKRKRREEERRKRKETEKQKKLAEKEIKIKDILRKKLLKKPDKNDEQDLDKLNEKRDCGDIEKGKWDKNMKSKQLDTVTRDQKEKASNAPAFLQYADRGSIPTIKANANPHLIKIRGTSSAILFIPPLILSNVTALIIGLRRGTRLEICLDYELRNSTIKRITGVAKPKSLNKSRFSPYRDIPMEISCLSATFHAYSITWLHTFKTDKFSAVPGSLKSQPIGGLTSTPLQKSQMLGTSLSLFSFVSRSSGTVFLSRGGSPSHNPRVVQTESDKEQREHGRRLREKDPDRPRCREDERKRPRHHYEFDKFVRRKEETKWGKGYCHDRAKKDIHNSYSYCLDGDKLGKEDRGDDLKDCIHNKSVLVHQEKRTSHSEGRDVIGGALPAKDRPAMQLYQPGARSRTRLGSGGKSYDCSSKSPDRIVDRKFEAATGTGSEKSGDE